MECFVWEIEFALGAIAQRNLQTAYRDSISLAQIAYILDIANGKKGGKAEDYNPFSAAIKRQEALAKDINPELAKTLIELCTDRKVPTWVIESEPDLADMQIIAKQP